MQDVRDQRRGQAIRLDKEGGYGARRFASRMSRRPSYYDLLEMATRRGAEVLGMDGEIGSLEAGKKADLITFDLGNPYLNPTQDPITSFVLYGSSRDIDNVLVEGRFLKKNGAMTTIDLESALEKAQAKCREIIDRFFHDNPDQRKKWEAVRPREG